MTRADASSSAMGSISHLEAVTDGLMEAIKVSGGKEHAQQNTRRFMWPKMHAWKEQGPNDALWKAVDILVSGTLPEQDENKEYLDWYKKASRLVLSLASTRQLLIKWCGIHPSSPHCDPPHAIVHTTPKAYQLQDREIQKILESQGNIQESIFATRSITIPQGFPVHEVLRKIQNNRSHGMMMSHCYNDLKTPIGYFSSEKIPSPPVTQYSLKHPYNFGRQSMVLPVVWEYELVPRQLVGSSEQGKHARYSMQDVCASQVYQLLLQAYKEDVPLVAYNQPQKRKRARSIK